MQRLTYHNALLECRRTPWDERIFAFPCAEITTLQAIEFQEASALLRQFDAWARQEDINFAYGRFEPSVVNKKALYGAGFYFAEASYRLHHARIQYSQALDELIRPGLRLAPAQSADFPVMQEILAADFEHGRIHEDPWVQRSEAADRYRYWLLDLQAQAYTILAYQLKGQTIGLHIQRNHSDSTEWILTGLKRSHALLGASLWADVLKWNRERGVHKVSTLVSAANIPILNLYKRLDFQFESLWLGFHKRY